MGHQRWRHSYLKNIHLSLYTSCTQEMPTAIYSCSRDPATQRDCGVMCTQRNRKSGIQVGDHFMGIFFLIDAAKRGKFFLLEVGERLVDEHMRRRAQNRTIAGHPLVASAVALLGVLAAPTEPETQSTCNKRRGRCANCPRTNDQKVVNRCQNCGNFTCGQDSHLSFSMSKPIR